MGIIIKAIITSVATALFRAIGERVIAVTSNVRKDVVDTLNDKDLQRLALGAVAETAKKGLKGDEAYKDAFTELSSALKQRGEIIATNVIDTLLQTAVTVHKNPD